MKVRPLVDVISLLKTMLIHTGMPPYASISLLHLNNQSSGGESVE